MEIVLLTLIFTAQAAWPPPDPNEPHYLGKAKHFWNPDWAARDFFFNSSDTHRVFYLTLGWLTRYLQLEPLAWCGRLATWALLAWAWRRLSWTVAPRPGLAVLSGFLFLTLSAGYQLAGEWVVGGFEAKGLAYVLVFLALAEIARDRWRAACLLLGAASAFHVLVGGWSVVAAGCGWLLAGRERLPLRRLWPALLGGLLLSLPGLLPGLTLDHGADPQTLRQAHEIYVFERLPHHLLPQSFRAGPIVAQMWMVVAWFALGTVLAGEAARTASSRRRYRRLAHRVGRHADLAVRGQPSRNDCSATAALLVPSGRCDAARRRCARRGGCHHIDAALPPCGNGRLPGCVPGAGRLSLRRIRRLPGLSRAAAHRQARQSAGSRRLEGGLPMDRRADACRRVVSHAAQRADLHLVRGPGAGCFVEGSTPGRRDDRRVAGASRRDLRHGISRVSRAMGQVALAAQSRTTARLRRQVRRRLSADRGRSAA